MSKKFGVKRSIAAVMAALLLGQTVPLAPVSRAVEEQHGQLGAAVLDCYPSLSYDGEQDIYRLEMELNAEFYDHKVSEDSTIPDRGFFTANYTGEHLIELWGGNGADGADGDEGRAGGTGGQGGYVYGKIYLEKGQTLFYSLGGNGSLTYATGAGGGANNGGGGGRSITHGVGGGGGYSALFLFEGEDFAQRYLDANGKLNVENISEVDRATRYVMIAGGGGGGGGAPGAGAVSATRAAHGGDGGNMNSLSGEIAAGENAVAGRYYAGERGQSSGNTESYIGYGGSDQPGKVVSTVWSWYDGELPNDWNRISNPGVPGGAGGAGNLRGGAGGAGFCGGSGGVQQSLISPTQVGGGGGGSSFVAAVVNTELTDDEMSLLDGTHTGTQGGAVAITYLPEEDADHHFDHLSDLTITFSFTEYFNPAMFELIEGINPNDEPSDAYDDKVSYDPDTRTITITGISLLPSSHNLTGALLIRLGLRPKTAFAGGNGVPMLEENGISVCVSGDGAQRCDIKLPANLCCVNVPLRFDVGAQQHVTNTPVTMYPQNMYTDHYAGVRVLPGEIPNPDDPMCDFIAKISAHTVEGIAPEGTTVTKTTAFPVSLTVTPKDTAVDSVLGGKMGVTTFTQESLVTVLALHQGKLNGETMNFIKNLQYDTQTGDYLFSVTTRANSSLESHLPVDIAPKEGASSGDDIDIPHDGWYLIQVWGGSGADGVTIGPRTGGAGGKSGYSYLYLHLEENDKLKLVSLGAAGSLPDTSKELGGGGGTRTEISYKNQTLVIAGGGGGGGNAFVGNILSFLGANGEAGGNASDQITAGNKPNNDRSTYDGKSGVGNGGFNLFGGGYYGGDGGAGGANYRSNAKGHYVDYDATVLTEDYARKRYEEAVADNEKPETGGAGYFRVTCLQVDEEIGESVLEDYTLGVQFSRYFKVVGVSGSDVYSDGNTLNYGTVNYANTETKTLVTVPAIQPAVKEQSKDGEKIDYIDFTVTFRLQPREGFLGGNDVPIMDYEVVGTATGDYPTGAKLMQKDDSVDISRYVTSDDGYIPDPAHYANVAVPESVHPVSDPEDQRLVTNRVHYDGTGAGVARSDLYTWIDPWVKPTGEQAWTADFLSRVETMIPEDGMQDIGWDNLAPDHNTHYSVTVGVSVAEPVHVPEEFPVLAQSRTLTKTAAILVQPKMEYILTNLTTGHSPLHGDHDSMAPDQPFSLKLVPRETGYGLPASIAIAYEDPALADVPVAFSYDSLSGEVTISAESVGRGDMILTATGEPLAYKINYHYELLGTTQTGLYSQTYLYGEQVTAWEWNGEDDEGRPVPGYDFEWTWYRAPGALASGPPVTMPARDVTVVGRYNPKDYLIVVEYWLDNGTDGAEMYSQTEPIPVQFGESFSIPSPVVPGYVATELFFNGEVDTDLIAGATASGDNTPVIRKEVTYTKLSGRLRIDYVLGDTGEVFDSYVKGFETGDAYSVISPEYPGYLPDQAVVTGTMAAGEVEQGKLVIVTYTPQQYKVTFDPQGGNCLETSRVVKFNALYGETDDGYEFLPEASRAGYTFDGWYLGDQKVTANMTVTTPGDHVLTARWTGKEVVLLIQYKYNAVGNKDAAPEIRRTLKYGDSYRFESPELEGFTANYPVVEGTMPGHNVQYTVLYTGEECTLTIRYVRFGETEPFQTVTKTLRYKDEYSVTSPVLDGFTCARPVVEGTMEERPGTVITVLYHSQTPVIAVTITWGETGMLSYEYTRSWNPDELQYDVSITPSTVDSNRVRVRNDGSRVGDKPIAVEASLRYTPDDRYPNLSGWFTTGNTDDSPHVTTGANIPSNGVKDIWMWLTGRLPDTVSGNLIAGTCTVTLSAAGGE